MTVSTTTIDAVERLLESVLAATEDAERRFKLRTALQLLVFLRESHDVASETLAEADLEPELEDQLRQLGYLG